MDKPSIKNSMFAGGHDRFNKLAEKLKLGDMKAGAEIFNYFSPLIYRFFMARILNRGLAEDLTQDVFMKVVSKIETYNGKLGNFSGWIWQIARNSLVDYYREKKETVFADMPEGMEDIFKTDDNTMQKVMVKEILGAVKNLSEEEQEIFALHYLSDLAYREISRMTGKSEGSLRVMIHRLNKKIRDIIDR